MADDHTEPPAVFPRAMRGIRIGVALLACAAVCAGAAHTSAAASGAAAKEGVFWVYRLGAFNWQGDYSWGVKIDYRDASAGPAQGKYAISVRGVGGFQPYAQNNDFDPSRFSYLTFSLKPTLPDQLWDSGFEAVGDVPVGKLINLASFGPKPVVGQWGTYKIPLGEGGYQIPRGTHIYKFMIQDQTADQPGGKYKTNLWYVDDIAFTAD